MLQLSRLRCELLTEPLGLSETAPRLSWELSEGRQTAYRLQADNGWDTGRIESDASFGVEYGGPALESRQRIAWKVTVWNDAGEEASGSSTFEMGLLDKDEWTAVWIQNPLAGGARSLIPAPHFRRDFQLSGPIASARLYITALGIYEARLNGQRIGDEELSPGWTDYKTRIRFATYDVASHLREGANCLGAVLGSGWYCGHVSWNDRQFYGDRPRLLAQLEVVYTNGRREVIGTDAGWQTGFGETLHEDLLMGEAVDMRRVVSGWDLPGFSGWVPVQIGPEYDGELNAWISPPIRVVKKLLPVDKRKLEAWPKPRYRWDFGQNLVGRVRLLAKGKGGETSTVRYAERLDAKGNLYTENYRGARSTDYFTLAPGENDITTRFTFHGFQYAELTNLDEDAALEAYVLSSDLEPAGTFRCSDPLLDQLWRNIEWGWRGNSLDVPTDCPQRDERLGWTGDAQVFVRTAMFVSDAQTFFEKFEQDLTDSQDEEGNIPPVAPNPDVLSFEGGPAWSDAFVICPWTVYRCTGDDRILGRHYDPMAKWVRSLTLSSKDHIRAYEGYEKFRGFGDWLNTNADTPNELIGTAFYAHVARLMARIAAVVGRDGSEFSNLADEVAEAFVGAFGDRLESQTANVLALHFDLLPEEMRARALDALVQDIEARDDHLSTGFVGTPYLMHVLTQGGKLDVAYRLLLQKSWPSWLYSVTQGATTIWERWDGWTEDKGFQDPGMNSFNHYAYGAIGDWLTSTVAGIDLDPEISGYKRSRLAPRPGGGLTRAEASLKTGYGRLASKWEIVDDTFRWDVEVPANTTANAELPPEAGGERRALAPGRHRLEGPWRT